VQPPGSPPCGLEPGLQVLPTRSGPVRGQPVYPHKALANCGLPVLARSVTPAGAYNFGPGRLQLPVAIDGVVVFPAWTVHDFKPSGKRCTMSGIDKVTAAAIVNQGPNPHPGRESAAPLPD
jgi:hypothetical protein